MRISGLLVSLYVLGFLAEYTHAMANRQMGHGEAHPDPFRAPPVMRGG